MPHDALRHAPRFHGKAIRKMSSAQSHPVHCPWFLPCEWYRSSLRKQCVVAAPAMPVPPPTTNSLPCRKVRLEPLLWRQIVGGGLPVAQGCQNAQRWTLGNAELCLHCRFVERCEASQINPGAHRKSYDPTQSHCHGEAARARPLQWSRCVAWRTGKASALAHCQRIGSKRGACARSAAGQAQDTRQRHQPRVGRAVGIDHVNASTILLEPLRYPRRKVNSLLAMSMSTTGIPAVPLPPKMGRPEARSVTLCPRSRKTARLGKDANFRPPSQARPVQDRQRPLAVTHGSHYRLTRTALLTAAFPMP